MSQQAAATISKLKPKPAASAPKPKAAADSPESKSKPTLVNPSLPTDLASLKQHPPTRPALNARNLCNPHIRKAVLPSLTLTPSPPNQSRNNVLLVIPTANKAKTELLLGHLTRTKPKHIHLDHLTVPAESDVGEQPYDSAGPRGAVNRVVNALAKLQAEHRDVLVARGIGTVVVGAVENFILRKKEKKSVPQPQPQPGAKAKKVTTTVATVPVDYGVVMFCWIPLAGGGKAPAPTWVAGVSGGVVAPVEYWREAGKYGYEDAGKRHGKVTVGEVIAANVKGWDKADWHLPLAGESRYKLLRETVEGMRTPWPAAK